MARRAQGIGSDVAGFLIAIKFTRPQMAATFASPPSADRPLIDVDGRIHARNLPERGCVFTVDLPRLHVPAAEMGNGGVASLVTNAWRQTSSSTFLPDLQGVGVRANLPGKEALVAVLEAGHFFGEGCLAGQLQRIATATAMALSTIRAVEKQEMMRQLHDQPAFADRFLTHMLTRNIRHDTSVRCRHADVFFETEGSDEHRLLRTGGTGVPTIDEWTLPLT